MEARNEGRFEKLDRTVILSESQGTFRHPSFQFPCFPNTYMLTFPLCRHFQELINAIGKAFEAQRSHKAGNR
jgi:hypothetical protein